jgi:RNA polymerase subunit RPABC4/transcription elongation factor Spt4
VRTSALANIHALAIAGGIAARDIETEGNEIMNIAQNWRLNNQRYALKAVRCETCQQVTFPPREVCPRCAETAKHAQAAYPVIVLPEVMELRRAGR